VIAGGPLRADRRNAQL